MSTPRYVVYYDKWFYYSLKSLFNYIVSNILYIIYTIISMKYYQDDTDPTQEEQIEYYSDIIKKNNIKNSKYTKYFYHSFIPMPT